MGDLIRYKDANGKEIFIELNQDTPKGGNKMVLYGAAKKTVTDAAKSLEESLGKLDYLSQMIIDSVTKDKDKSPSEVNVEFGIKLGGSADFIVASGSVEANFKISLTWKKPSV